MSLSSLSPTVRDRRQGGAGMPLSILPLGGSIELQLLSRGSLRLTPNNLCNIENPLECCLNHVYCFFRLSLHFKIHRGKNSSEVLGKAKKATRVIYTQTLK
ncbi:unnamed protein product [Rangifer tarandus platyrhynchus]|uniref:Uncharacterized protein n=1 Tax=Rangifer tarandus platyrhynchus TaxID=3082113 RepID=A0ABN8Z6A9_RANTA|nr:unnamed protein product [Rangifer tarandus platyrhynchus]